MIILSIETSCDDTCLALVELRKSQIKILADFVSSQNKLHAPFGGVVPHLAARAHWRNLPLLLEKTLTKIEPKKIGLLAVTVGPGLEPSLWAGIRLARLLSLSLGKPIIGVNHLEGHIAANWLNNTLWSDTRKGVIQTRSGTRKGVIQTPFGPLFKGNTRKSVFPAICLVVSGGHTQLVLIKDFGQYQLLGQTRDDAAGEAFDKVAKLLGLEYPGGPIISQLAKKGNPCAFDLPRPMIHSQDYDFSFSGLKTAVLYLVSRCRHCSRGFYRLSRPQNSENSLPKLQYQENFRNFAIKSEDRKQHRQWGFLLSDLSASFQQAVIDVLVNKTIKAAKEYQVKTVMLSGGVAANSQLRRQMGSAIKKQIPNTKYQIPDTRFCTDNAVMIALAGYWEYIKNGENRIKDIIAKPNLNL